MMLRSPFWKLLCLKIFVVLKHVSNLAAFELKCPLELNFTKSSFVTIRYLQTASTYVYERVKGALRVE